MISFTDVLHDLVRRGMTLRFDPEGQLFIYDPQHTVRRGAAKAENNPPVPAKSWEPPNGVSMQILDNLPEDDGGLSVRQEPPNGVSMQILDSLPEDDGGLSVRHAAALAARCRRASLLAPEAGSAPPQPPGPQWRGITWQDVPGHDESIQKLNFALLKRGMLRGHKCCRPLQGEVLKQRLQELSQRNRDNSQGRREQSRQRRKANPRPKPP